MFGKAKVPKKVLVEVMVRHHDQSGKEPDSETRIEVPAGCQFKLRASYQNQRLYDGEGNVLKEWDFQAGFSHEYQFMYDA